MNPEIGQESARSGLLEGAPADPSATEAAQATEATAEIPYFAISRYYKDLFGEKVYKIPLSVADTCPNRLGLRGMKTCSFCDVWGSAAYPEVREESITRQLEINKERILKRVKARSFLAYFQAYTNSFAKLAVLKQRIDESLAVEGVKGIVVGTRPDCVSQAVLRLWQETHERSWVSVELGVQSFFDDQLEFMRRGHTAAQSIEAIEKIAEATTVDLGIHLIFGNPGETEATIIETARICNRLPIKHVKLHNLHVLQKTHLAELYALGQFQPIELDAYARRVVLFLRHLRPDIAVHRLAALSSRWEELVAPDWTRSKFMAHTRIVQSMLEMGYRQGDLS